jgi:hypothetical protein
VTVTPIPAAPVVTNNGYILSSSVATGNQWYFEGALISGATAQTYDATLSGTGHYWSVITINGCSSDTSNHQYVIVIGVQTLKNQGISIYPVPNDGKFTVSMTGFSNESFTISVMNALGVVIFENKDVEVTGNTTIPIDLRPTPNGVYTVVIRNTQGQVVKRIIVTK